MAKLGVQKLDVDEMTQPVEVPVDATLPGPLESAKLETFEDLTSQQQIQINSAEAAKFDEDHRMVEIRVRDNVPRTCICGRWYTFVKGKTTVVPRYVKDWLDGQGLL